MKISDKQKKIELTITRFIKKDPLAFYDIGVGPKSEWKVLSDFYPGMGIFGVEPNPLMHKFILENNYPGQLLNKAIAPSRGYVNLHVYRSDGLDASILKIPGRSQSAEFSVETITLDDADACFGMKNNILLWMDIEGAELLALKSGRNLLESQRVRWINLEVRENPPWENGCKGSEIDIFLSEFNYKRVHSYNSHPHVGHCDAIYVLDQN